jgi:hypothetical protein
MICAGCGSSARAVCAACAIASVAVTLDCDSATARAVAAALLPDLLDDVPDADRIRHRLRALLTSRTADTRTPDLFS